MNESSSNGSYRTVPPSSWADARLRRSRWMMEDLMGTIEQVPDAAEKYYGLALILVMLGSFKEAMKNLQLAVGENPDHVSALFLLGELHFKLGSHQRAAELLEQVVIRDPENMTAVTWLCLAYHCLGNKGKALMQQSALQSLAPDLVVTVLKK